MDELQRTPLAWSVSTAAFERLARATDSPPISSKLIDPVDDSSSSPPPPDFSHTPVQILSLLCYICLDNALYSFALNFALQLHQQALATHIMPIESMSASTNGDQSSFSAPPPLGLSKPLWSRLVTNCPVSTTDDEESLVHVVKANGDDRSCHTNGSPTDPLEEVEANAHFLQVHEFSVKEEQLRTHLHPPTSVDEETVSNKHHVDSLASTQSLPPPLNDSAAPIDDGIVDTEYEMPTPMTEPCEECHTHDEGDEKDAGANDDPDPRNADYLSGVYQKVPSASWIEEGGEEEDAEWHIENDIDYCSLDATTVAEVESSDGETSCYSSSYSGDDPLQTPAMRKRVRFSLGSTHLSPALEAEYGGRSNRRRLMDFVKRRQSMGDERDFSYLTGGRCSDHLASISLLDASACMVQLITSLILFLLSLRGFLWVCLILLVAMPLTLFTCARFLDVPFVQLWVKSDTLDGLLNEFLASPHRTDVLCTDYVVWLRHHWFHWSEAR